MRRPKLKRRRGDDQRYKEMKLVTIYDQPNDQPNHQVGDQASEHRLTRATRQGADKAARMLRQMRDDVHLRRADQVAAVTDGAERIARLIGDNLPEGTTAVLAYCH